MSASHGTRRSTALSLFLRSWEHWLHLGYAALLIATYFAVGAHEARDTRILVAYVGVFAYVLILLTLLAYFIISYSRKARYAEATICIHAAIHRLRDIGRYLDRCAVNHQLYENEKVKDEMRASLDAVAQAFSIVSAVSNRACIKSLAGTNASFVHTLCRDSVSHQKHRDADKKEGDRHQIDKNTAYREIIRGERSYFLSNNLPKLAGEGRYDNTSANWHESYVSCLVLPIRCVIEQDELENKELQKRIQVLGLLAIDSAGRGTYRQRYDVDMGAIVADALYTVLDRWDRVAESVGKSLKTAATHR